MSHLKNHKDFMPVAVFECSSYNTHPPFHQACFLYFEFRARVLHSFFYIDWKLIDFLGKLFHDQLETDVVLIQLILIFIVIHLLGLAALKYTEAKADTATHL